MLGHVIETERLLLRPLRVSDVDAFVELHADPQVNHFVGSLSRQQAFDRLTAIERQWAERGHGLCAIELKSSGNFIGRSGLQYWEQFDEVELGWTLSADHWGHGYASEAAQACLDWGFARLDDDYFTALMRPGNDASVRVALRLGFAPRREDHLQGRPVTVYAVEPPPCRLALRHIGSENSRTGPEGQRAPSRRGVTMVRSGMVTRRSSGCSTSTSVSSGRHPRRR
jgi:RimJ/RimL family protein N-acetyltransferase